MIKPRMMKWARHEAGFEQYRNKCEGKHRLEELGVEVKVIGNSVLKK
jgi:hypothetical protein